MSKSDTRCKLEYRLRDHDADGYDEFKEEYC